MLIIRILGQYERFVSSFEKDNSGATSSSGNLKKIMQRVERQRESTQDVDGVDKAGEKKIREGNLFVPLYRREKLA
jgi:hypothetical protein